MSAITENIHALRSGLPSRVKLVAVAKSRADGEVREAVDAGVSLIGENYIQEALAHQEAVGRRVEWHCIGHIQKNKVNKAVRLFDMIQTVDSEEIASAIDTACAHLNKIMPVLIEVNSGRERQKHGVYPEDVISLIQKISAFSHIRVEGLMTMGPVPKPGEDIRPYFRLTRSLFDQIARQEIHRVSMQELSMGMSGSYLSAVEEGATMVRIGTRIFGERLC